MSKNETIWTKFKQVHRNIYIMGLVSFATQLGAALIYTTAETLTKGFLTPSIILVMRSFSESTSTMIKVVAGVIGDYFKSAKLLLSISYGAMICVKIVFLICIFISDNILGPQSKFIIYITYLYVTTFVIDRIMACLRDAPQAVLILEAIADSNKQYISSGDKDKAEGNVIFSLGVRKAIGSFGSVLGGILAYIIIKFKLMSGSALYVLAIIPVIISNIILYFGMRDVQNNMRDEYITDDSYNNYNYDKIDMNDDNISSDMTIINVSNINIVDKIQQTISSIASWSMNNFNIISIMYWSIAAILGYLYGTIKIKIMLLVMFYHLLSFGSNIVVSSLMKISLLFGLIHGYSIWALLGFVIGIYVKDSIVEYISTFELSSLFSILPFLNINIIYTILFYIFVLILAPFNYGYISLILIAGHQLVYNLLPGFHINYITTSLLVLSQIKVFTLTQHLWTYILYTVTSTLHVYNDTGYIYMILPKQVITLFQYLSMSAVPYQWVFYLSVILKNYTSFIESGIIYALSFLVPIGCKKIPYIGDSLSSSLVICNNSFISRISNSFHIVIAIRMISKYRQSFMKMILFGLLVFVFVCAFGSHLALITQLLICITGSVILFGLFNFAVNTELLKKCFTYKNVLASFGYTVFTLCMLHMGRCNDTMFFKHGVSIPGLTEKEIPLIFTFLYLSITVSSMLLSFLKQHKKLLFIIISLSLVISNLFLTINSLIGFMLVLIFLGVYTSGVEILFISMIKDVMPNDSSVSGTFLGIYYLCMSISTIINAILSVRILNIGNARSILKIYQYISPSLYSYIISTPFLVGPMVNLLFMIFPIISILIWLVLVQSRKKIQ